MRNRIITLSLIIIIVALFILSTKPLGSPFIPIRSSVTNDISNNITILVHTQSWHEGILRLKFTPKTAPISLTRFEIFYDKIKFVNFSELEGSLDFHKADEKVIEVTKPFPIEKLSPTNLVITAMEGSLSK
jgi:hypothetical protein